VLGDRLRGELVAVLRFEQLAPRIEANTGSRVFLAEEVAGEFAHVVVVVVR